MLNFLFLEAIVIDSKLTFKIQEIPEGKSRREITLSENDIRFDDYALNKAVVSIQFEKTIHFINVEFTVEAGLMITCDRSLELFEKRVAGHYKVLFKPEVESVTESELSKVKPFDIRELTLSIDDEVRDTILLGLPVKVLHPRFLDDDGNPLEFETRSFGDISPDDDSIADPRWEALKKLKN
jgi:uncharacterized metal-binding protein YceD (DUF177 family)